MERFIEVLDQYVDAKMSLKFAKAASGQSAFVRKHKLREAKQKVARLRILLLACCEESLGVSADRPGGTQGPQGNRPQTDE